MGEVIRPDFLRHSSNLPPRTAPEQKGNLLTEDMFDDDDPDFRLLPDGTLAPLDEEVVPEWPRAR